MNEQIQGKALAADLKWVLQCPSLLTLDPRLWDPSWLTTPDEPILEPHLSRLLTARKGKLGRYFETMVSYLFHCSNRFEVLAENQLVFDGHITLGELDILVKDTSTGRVLHIELALKFYLWVPKTPVHQYGWIGSGLADFLADKIARLTDHQLRLPDIASHKGCWPPNLPKPDAHYLWMPGRLYLPPGESAEVVGDTQFSGNGFTLNPLASLSYWYMEGEHPAGLGPELHKSDWLNGQPIGVPRLNIPAQFKSAIGNPVYILPEKWHTDALVAINQRVTK